MFVTDFSAPLLKTCISAALCGKCPRFMTQFLQIVDKYDGCIFGSTVTAYVLRDNKLNDKRPNDVDILVRDVHAYNSFIIEMNVLLQQVAKTISAFVKMSQTEQFYTFTDLLADGESSVTNIKLAKRGNSKNVLNVHIVYLKSGGCPSLTSIIPNEYISTLFKDFFDLDFTKAVYYKGKIYSKLSTINVVHLTPSDVNTPAKEAFIQKYSDRGIKFIRVNTPVNNYPTVPVAVPVSTTIPQEHSAPLKPDYLALSAAKKRYQSMGLVVIPLKRKSERPDGKSPAVAQWAKMNRSYDFNVQRCDNIGIVCGPNSGIVCIDVDQKDNGMHYFQKMATRYGMPVCPTQTTPNGGRHYIFRYDYARMRGMVCKIKGCSVNGNRVGIDLWIDRCQFVASPSINYLNGGMYKWIVPFNSREDLPALPEWIYDLYNYKNVTEDGEIIKDTISDTTSEVRSESTSETKRVRTEVPSTRSIASNGEKISFEVDVKSIPWLTLVLLAILAIVMSIVIAIAVVISLLIFIIVPTNMKGPFKQMFTKIFMKALEVFG